MTIQSAAVKHLYTAEYFLNQVDGAAAFADYQGEFSQLFRRFQRNVRLLNLRPEDAFLDIGCGRGEIVIYHHKRGGRMSVGVDFSPDAIRIAQEKSRQLGLDCRFICASFQDIPEDVTYDKILASEFIEHISNDEAILFFRKAFRLLSPEGRLLVFSHPNRYQRRFGYPFLRFVSSVLLGTTLPRKPRDAQDDHFQSYHLHEQDYFTLSSLVKKAGFTKSRIFYDPHIWDRDSPLPSILRSAIHGSPLKHLFLTDLTVLAGKNR
jgi:2-polyprenyl-3-methyl-5-hydroxy-6-metoxy-1,4-benzoquinol methylase